MSLLLKVCGITREEDARAAAEAGAHWCGFIFHAPSPRGCSAPQAAAIRTPGLARVGVFVDQDAGAIREIMDAARLDMAQLHGGRDAAFTAECARLIGARRLIRAFWPQRHPSITDLEEHMKAHAPCCAFFLLDAGADGGGSGRSLEWAALRGLEAPRPWLLAGGLNADNVVEALRQCAPGGLDFNSGVEEAPGRKDARKIRAALTAGRRARKEDDA